MFAKLLKYEWKTTRGVLGWLSLAALGVGILGSVLLRITISGTSEYLQNSAGYESRMLMPTVMTIVMIFLIFALFAYALGSQIFLLYRFYKSKFTDQGYLTFTLPVTPAQIFLSSFVNMVIWMVIAALVIIISVAAMIFVGVISSGVFDSAAMQDAQQIYGDIIASEGWAEFWWFSVLRGVLSFIYGLVMAMTCVTIGSIAAKKHKILAAFGIYYVISMVSGILNSVVTFFVANTQTAEIAPLYLCEMGIQAVMILGGFFLSTWLMKHKLNLP